MAHRFRIFDIALESQLDWIGFREEYATFLGPVQN